MVKAKTLSFRGSQGLFVLAWLLLLWGILWLYAPALKFGLIWDDPEWFGRVVGIGWGELLRPFPDYQFYRPGTMLYNRLFFGADGLLHVYALHWLQIAWHLLNVAFLFALSRRMGFSRWAALTAVALFGVYPLSQQAISWAAPQQPMVLALQNATWLLYLTSRRRSGYWLWLLSLFIFIVGLMVQESTAPFGVLPLAFEAVLRAQKSSLLAVLSSWRHPIRNGWLRPLSYLLVAILFLAIWWFVPREAGITRPGLDWRVSAFFLQGFVFPVAWLTDSSQLTAVTWLAIFSCALIGLWFVGVWRGRGLLASAGLLWGVLGASPALIGLPFSYVQYSQRLLYFVAPGATWMLVCAFWPSDNGRRPAINALGLVVLGVIFGGSVWQLAGFQAMYQVGTTHLQALVAEIGGQDGRFLFINFPDRFSPRVEPYPFGYWGVTLAPVVVDLGEFPAMQVGGALQTLSKAVPSIDEVERAEGPFQVDMRGVIAQPQEIYALAQDYDAVYLSRYDAAGNFTLQRVGGLEKQEGDSCVLAQFGQDVCLQSVEITDHDDAWEVRLAWAIQAELTPFVTVFTHIGRLGQPPLAQADGNAWRGMLPLRYWQPGDLIIDVRTIPKPEQMDGVSLQIGLYDGLSGERFPAWTADGRPLPDNAYSQLLTPSPLEPGQNSLRN